MKITTGRGDRGRTEILFRKKIDKDSEILEAAGALDELNAFLGLAKAETKRKRFKNVLRACQESLFVIGAEISCPASRLTTLKRRISKQDIQWIEGLIELFGEKLGKGPSGFVIPGSDRPSALLDISRCVARKVERRLVTLYKKKILKNPNILVFINRLSDLLWLLARASEKETEVFTADKT